MKHCRYCQEMRKRGCAHNARLPNKQGREMQLVLARTHLGLVRLVHVHTKLLSNLIYKRRFVSLLRFAVRQCAVDESPARRV